MPWLNIVFIIFIISFSIQFIYFWGIYSRLAFYRKKDAADKNYYRPVSVVISAKNEFENLKENLPLILEQDYPDFEVVVVNDCSDDDTEFLLRKLSETYERLKVVNIMNNVNFFSGKKFPLSMGIKSAKNDVLLLTDADCRPNSKNWIHEIQSNYSELTQNSKLKTQNNTSIVLGYGGYFKKKGLLNKIIRYDTLRVAIEYFSLALSGFPYMGVGRNLSYTKKLFYENKGFTSHYTIKSGDDDLFINSVAKRRNARIEISPDSHTLSEPKTTFSAWMTQKKRHLSTGKHYKLRHKLLLGLFSLSQLIFFATFIVLVSFTYQLIIILLLLTIRLISLLIINKKCIDKLNEKNLLLFSPIFELIILIINIYLSFINIIFKNNKWK